MRQAVSDSCFKKAGSWPALATLGRANLLLAMLFYLKFCWSLTVSSYLSNAHFRLFYVIVIKKGSISTIFRIIIANIRAFIFNYRISIKMITFSVISHLGLSVSVLCVNLIELEVEPSYHKYQTVKSSFKFYTLNLFSLDFPPTLDMVRWCPLCE